MSRTDFAPVNPNHFVGNHPNIPFYRSDEDPSDRPIDDQIVYSRFTPASFLDGIIHHQRQLSKRRSALERILLRLKRSNISEHERVSEYLHHMYRRNCNAKTICTTTSTLVFFFLFMQQRGKNRLELVERRDLEAFVEHEQDRGLKPKTIHFHVQTLYAFFRYLSDRKIIRPELHERRIRIRVPQSLPRAIPPADVYRIFSVVDTIRNHAIFLMLLRTGMRIGELLSVRVNDVDLIERTVKIYKGEKNSVGRVVYLSDDAAEALTAWLKIRDCRKAYLFYGRNGGLGYTAVLEQFRSVLAKAGLSDKGYTLHCLRHTFATDLLNAGMRLECLQQLLGHASIDVTRIYARLTDATREEEYFRAMEKIEKGEADGYQRLDCQL